MKRKQVDPKIDAGKHAKPYYSGNNNHTTTEYGMPIDELRHPEKNGVYESKPNAGVFDIGKNPFVKEFAKRSDNSGLLSEIKNADHPEKINIVPLAGGVRTKKEIENHENEHRGGPVSQPNTHVGVKPHKQETSQQIGARRQANANNNLGSATVTTSRKAIDKQLQSDGIEGTNSSPKARESNQSGTGHKAAEDKKALSK